MKILSKMPTGLGGNFILVEYENEFFAHGTEKDLTDKWGFPVDSCGSKEEVLEHCKSILELCKENIIKYTNSDFGILLEQNRKEAEALKEFINVLSK